MASIPAKARQLVAKLTQRGWLHKYKPATSPGYSHEVYAKTAKGRVFTVLVEQNAITVWDFDGRGCDAYYSVNAAVTAIGKRCTQN